MNGSHWKKKKEYWYTGNSLVNGSLPFNVNQLPIYTTDHVATVALFLQNHALCFEVTSLS
jgi:hypothetical protein